VRLSPLVTEGTVWPIVPAPYDHDDDDDICRVIGGMIIGKGNQSTRKKPAPVPLCPPQITHDLGTNPDRRGRKPSTNRLSYGMALHKV
jgi:hypothetical protein